MGTVDFFIFIVVHKGSTHVFMNFQPGLENFSDYMAKFSAQVSDNRAEISARAEHSPCNQPLGGEMYNNLQKYIMYIIYV